MRRTTGVRLNIEFVYNVDADKKTAEAEMQVSFDEGIQPYSTEVFETLSLYFGERFVLHRGSSHELLPRFAASGAATGACDVGLVYPTVCQRYISTYELLRAVHG